MKKNILFTLFLANAMHANDIIVWDLHDVVLTRSGTIATLVEFPYKKEFFQNLSWPLFKEILDIVWSALFNEASSESFIHLAEKYDNPYLAQLTIRISNAQRPMPGIQEVITSLEEEGFEHHIGSNIGASSFEDLLDEEKNPDVAPLIKRLNPKKAQVVPYNNGDIIKKPDPRFFKAYLQKNQLNPKKDRIIFIDDKKENVDEARRHGLIGIQFHNTPQLQRALAKEGIEISAAHDERTHFEAYKDCIE